MAGMITGEIGLVKDGLAADSPVTSTLTFRAMEPLMIAGETQRATIDGTIAGIPHAGEVEVPVIKMQAEDEKSDRRGPDSLQGGRQRISIVTMASAFLLHREFLVTR